MQYDQHCFALIRLFLHDQVIKNVRWARQYKHSKRKKSILFKRFRILATADSINKSRLVSRNACIHFKRVAFIEERVRNPERSCFFARALPLHAMIFLNSNLFSDTENFILKWMRKKHRKNILDMKKMCYTFFMIVEATNALASIDPDISQDEHKERRWTPCQRKRKPQRKRQLQKRRRPLPKRRSVSFFLPVLFCKEENIPVYAGMFSYATRVAYNSWERPTWPL